MDAAHSGLREPNEAFATGIRETIVEGAHLQIEGDQTLRAYQTPPVPPSQEETILKAVNNNGHGSGAYRSVDSRQIVSSHDLLWKHNLATVGSKAKPSCKALVDKPQRQDFYTAKEATKGNGRGEASEHKAKFFQRSRPRQRDRERTSHKAPAGEVDREDMQEKETGGVEKRAATESVPTQTGQTKSKKEISGSVPVLAGGKSVAEAGKASNTEEVITEESEKLDSQNYEDQGNGDDLDNDTFGGAGSVAFHDRTPAGALDVDSMITRTELAGNRCRYTFDLKIPDFAGRFSRIESEVSSKFCYVQSFHVQGSVFFLPCGLQAWFNIRRSDNRTNRHCSEGGGSDQNNMKKPWLYRAISDENEGKILRSEVNTAKVKAALVGAGGKLSEIAIGPGKDVNLEQESRSRLSCRLGLLHCKELVKTGYTSGDHGGGLVVVRFTIEMATPATTGGP